MDFDFTLVNVIDLLMRASVAFTAIQVYLQINKIWKRKHEKEVAESQSIAGSILMGLTCILSISYYAIVQKDSTSAYETSIYLFQAITFGLISTGLWVKSDVKLSIWDLIKKAIRLERKEADYLIKKFFKPTNAEIIIGILHQLAMIDDYLDPKEKELIEAFAKEWKIEYDADKMEKSPDDSENNFVRLRNSVSEYLENEPQKEQAAQLRDMMNTLINIDDNVSPEEELINSELMGLIDNYIKGENESKSFDVLVVPQRNEHHDFIQQLLPNAKRYEVAGGIAYSIGSFYSMKYAEMICNQYREVNLFTIVHSDINKEKPLENNTQN